MRGDPSVVGAVASRISGSSDIYQATGHLPINSINFVNCHDGFTLNDLVSFDKKHNLENGEGNNDGINDNLSWNCGVEGPTDNAEIEHLRNRQIKNFATTLMFSRGVPMFVMGDERRRTQDGNNNAYCQDNEISWMDWSLLERNKETYHFFRKTHPILHLPRFFSGDVNSRGVKDISWHGTRLNSPGWNDADTRALAFTLGGFDGDPDMHGMMNMYWDNLEFHTPVIPGRKWYKKNRHK